MNDIATKLGSLPDDKYNMAACKTGFNDIKDVQITKVDTEKAALLTSLDEMEATANKASGEVDKMLDAVTKIDERLDPTTSGNTFSIKDIVIAQAKKAIEAASTEVGGFIDYLFGQFQSSIGNCQPVAAVYYTLLNFTCDGILIHLTLLYCGLSLVGISLLFYMCVARCLARYFIKYDQLHPED